VHLERETLLPRCHRTKRRLCRHGDSRGQLAAPPAPAPTPLVCCRSQRPPTRLEGEPCPARRPWRRAERPWNSSGKETSRAVAETLVTIESRPKSRRYRGSIERRTPKARPKTGFAGERFPGRAATSVELLRLCAVSHLRSFG